MTKPADISAPTVVVAGAGLTGLSAAISARENDARVLLLERGSREDVGGNAAFSGGLFLFCYDGPDDLTSITEDFEPGMKADQIDAPPYTREAYVAELMAMSDGRADRELINALAQRSLDTMHWLTAKGVRFTFDRTLGATVRNGVLSIPPGQILTSTGEGMSRGFEVIRPLLAHAERIGVKICWSTLLTDLILECPGVFGRAVSGSFYAAFSRFRCSRRVSCGVLYRTPE